MISTIQTFCTEHTLFKSGSRIVVGLSGGPDSVFLVHFLHRYYKDQITLIAAHLDHQWRQESARDATFCKALSAELGIIYVETTMSEIAPLIKDKGSKEAFARDARRYFFEQVKTAYAADAIALAHHAQDQQETFFIRLMRGAGLSGLSSMRPKHGAYIRPLLETNKADILAYLHEHTIEYVIDSTNASPHFLRNRIREQVIPALKASDERFDHNFLRTLHNLQETENFLISLTRETLESICTPSSGIDCARFAQLPSVMQYRVLMQWLIKSRVPFQPTQSFLDEIMRFMASKETKHNIHHAWHLTKKNNCISMQHLNQPGS